MNRVLIVAYHFPPLAGSSGIQRTLRFVQHLPAFGWQPLVLTTSLRAYEATSGDLIQDIPPGTVVRRAFALDTARHLGVAGRYLGWMARPDRWITWKFAALREGLRMIREFTPDVIFSTYPIATAHVIGAGLHQRTGIPWIADFRDPMAQDGYPSDPLTWRSFHDIEARTVEQARFSVFTTPSAADIYRLRYPSAAGRIVVIENGFDEESFGRLAKTPVLRVASGGGPLILLHSGIVYPCERDPAQLFVALKRLLVSGRLTPLDMRIRFRASVHDELLRGMAAAQGVEEFIELAPPVAYREALEEMMSVDALLVLQGSSCNAQIPAKIYEYLRAGRPIIALTDPSGDTACALRKAGIDAIESLDSADAIAAMLPQFLAHVRAGRAALPETGAVQGASRRERTRELVNYLDRCLGGM